MPTEFSPTLLDNDPKFEYEPSKLIDVDSPKWFDWLEAHHSFRFTAGVGGENSYRARKELNKSQGVYYWYGVKKVDNKLHKKYIGKTNEVTHRRLIEVAEVIRQPSGKQPKDIDIQPGNTPQITPQFEDRLNNLEVLVQQLQSQIQDGTTAKKHDSPVVASQELTIELDRLSTTNTELTNSLDNRDKQLQKLTNELDIAKIDAKATKNDATLLNQEFERVKEENIKLTIELDSKNSKLTELANELTSKDSQLQELVNQIDNLNSKLTELTNNLANSVPVPQSPITNEELTTDNGQFQDIVTTTPSPMDNDLSPITEDEDHAEKNKQSHEEYRAKYLTPEPEKKRLSPVLYTRNYQIVSMLECQYWTDGKKFNNQDLKDNGIDKNIASNKLEIEAILGIVINPKDKIILKFASILKAMGFELKGNPTDGYCITNPEIY